MEINSYSPLEFQPEIKFRKGELDDTRIFNALVNKVGGANLFRAVFGSFSFAAIIDYSLTTLIAIPGDSEVEVKECCAFVAINDNTSLSADSENAKKIIEALSGIVDVKVSFKCREIFCILN